MKVISPANETVMQMLKNFRKPGTKYRKLKYLVDAEVEDGILVFNVLTRELVLLSREEFETATENEYLRKQWFVIPEECTEKEYADFIKLYLASKKPNLEQITGYTIFTTTDCNARCFYCFELGRSRIPMSRETALKTAEYIKSHCGGKRVKLSWFGGEPLMNTEAIDVICNYLKAEGIEYRSKMTSNGYLFNNDNITKATSAWNLKQVQITLDGTETVYNKVKAYVNKDGNPFQIVLDNIERLLIANVQVHIRLNMDLSNASNLLELIDVLNNRFNTYDKFCIYAHHLFNNGTPNAELYSEEEWDARDHAMQQINTKLAEIRLLPINGIEQSLKTNHCMADSGKDITILPDGSIGLCEHYTESEHIGHIENKEYKQEIVSRWRETIPQIPECNSCFYYPQCHKLKLCSNESVCYPLYRKDKLRNTIKAMRITYEYYIK